MHRVTSVTAIARDKDSSAGDVRRHPRYRRDVPLMPERTVTQLRAALARADRPVRARVLARDLGLPRAEVTAQLRHLQDVGVAVSSDRRWVAADADAMPARKVS
jgi:biotin operon repressor